MFWWVKKQRIIENALTNVCALISESSSGHPEVLGTVDAHCRHVNHECIYRNSRFSACLRTARTRREEVFGDTESTNRLRFPKGKRI